MTMPTMTLPVRPRKFAAIASTIQPAIEAMMAAASDGKWPLVAHDSPTADRCHGRAARSAITAGALNPRFEPLSWPGRLANHRPGDVVEPDDHAARPGCVFLARVRSDVDVDEPARRRALDEFTAEVRRAVLAVFRDRDRNVEGDVTAFTLLHEHGLVVRAASALDAVIDARGWLDQDQPEWLLA